MADPPLRAEPLELPSPQPYVEPDDDPEEETPPEPPPPREVTDIWGVSEGSLSLATHLIDAWGLHRFLNSELHIQAVKERDSDARMASIRKAYVEAQKKAAKK